MAELASEALIGIGTEFYRWDETSSSWKQLSEITDVSGPSKAREAVEVTHLNSPDKYKEFIKGLKEAGDVSLSMNFTRAQYDIMSTDFESENNQNYKIVIPDAERTTIEFEGMITELGLAIPVGDKITSDVTIKVSGKPTVSDSTAA